MRKLAYVVLAIFGACASVAAQDLPGFRLLVLGHSHVRWAGATADVPITITYAFVREPVAFAEARNCARMVPIDQLLTRSAIDRRRFDREFSAALAMWEEAANIRFKQVAEWRTAGILVGAQADPEGFAFTNVTQKTSPGSTGSIEQSLICLNPERRWKVGFDGDLTVLDIRYAMAHEIGHAIGLDHPSRSGQLMSYRYDEQFRTLQPGDRLGAAMLYGSKAGGDRQVRQPALPASRLAITPEASEQPVQSRQPSEPQE